MDLEAVQRELEVAVAAVHAGERTEIQTGLAAVAKVTSMCDHLRLRLAARLAECSASPADDIALATRTSRKQAKHDLDRAKTAEQAPEFSQALAKGAVSAEHLDELAHALKGLEPGERSTLLAREEDLARAARHCTPEELREVLDRAVAEARTDDGMRRLEQQRRKNRLRTWTRRSDGMFCMYGQFDPQSGITINAALEAQLQAQFAQPVPAEAPSDPAERNDFLRARGFVALIESGGGAVSTELVITLDTRDVAPDGTPRWDLGLGIDLPPSVIADLVRDARAWPVIFRGDKLVHTDGAMNLDRSQRLASRAQRRVLQAMYARCAIPGCTVPFVRTKIHHDPPWEHDGLTDLAMLVPLCPQHHGDVHAGRITLLIEHPKVTVTYHHDASARPPPDSAAA